MSFTLDDLDGVVVVRPTTSNLDARAARTLVPELAELLAEGRSVVVDLGKVAFVDSAGLGALAELHRRARAGFFALAAAPARLGPFLARLPAASLPPRYPTVEDATAAAAAGARNGSPREDVETRVIAFRPPTVPRGDAPRIGTA